MRVGPNVNCVPRTWVFFAQDSSIVEVGDDGIDDDVGYNQY